MKRFNLWIEDFNRSRFWQTKGLVQKIINRGFDAVCFHWSFREERLSPAILDEIADLLASLGRELDFLATVYIETENYSDVKKSISALNRYGFQTRLMVNEHLTAKQVISLRKRTQLAGLYIPDASYFERLRGCQTDLLINADDLTVCQFSELLDTWLSSKDACWVSCFQDLFSDLLTGSHVSDCCHDSCLGSTLLVDSSEDVYFCSKRKSGSWMYHMSADSDTPLYNDIYGNTLKAANEDRQRCMDCCDIFPACQGGCALDSIEDAACAAYRKKIEIVGNVISAHIEKGFTDLDNPLLRQMVLRMTAFGRTLE